MDLHMDLHVDPVKTSKRGIEGIRAGDFEGDNAMLGT